MVIQIIVIDNLLQFGLVYQKQGKFEKAIIEYNKAIEKSPSYAAAFQIRANAFSSLMNFEEVFKDYSIAIRINPQYSAAYFNRGLNSSLCQGLLHGKQGKLKKQQWIIQNTLRGFLMLKHIIIEVIKPSRKSQCIINLGNFYQAIRDYSKSIEINHQYAAAYNNRGNHQQINILAILMQILEDSMKLLRIVLKQQNCKRLMQMHSILEAMHIKIMENFQRQQQIIQKLLKQILSIVLLIIIEDLSILIREYLIKQYLIKQYQIIEKPQEFCQKTHYINLIQVFFSFLSNNLIKPISILKVLLNVHQNQHFNKNFEILSSINQELQIFKEELQDLQRNNIISQIQHQQYQFVINNIENQFLQIVPSQLNENQVEILNNLKLYKEKIKGLKLDLAFRTFYLKHKINKFFTNQQKKLRFIIIKKQLSLDQKLYYRSLFWHLFNYFYAINLISKDLQQINIQFHSVLSLEIFQKIQKLNNQVEESESMINQIFELLNSALDLVLSTYDNKSESRINCIIQILQQNDSASLFLANNINFYFEKDNMDIFNTEFDFYFYLEKYSENKFLETRILHTLIILNYLIENFKQLLIQSSFCNFQDVIAGSIIQFNSELFSKNQKEQSESSLS
ncbi:unnamed protein product [Paramecium pentaurelia]|uniref:Tetratricopeptide repeat protein n=1 Tax=Paramecium pentaurelia TaxID=43138 RepID=A0A8S1UR06_9CILI|nr:unnamed protein product [Paramecium pentaurelia]